VDEPTQHGVVTHEHEHEHHHRPTDWAESAHVHGGMPVLDIGGDIGALVVTLDRERTGTEVYVRPHDGHVDHIHSAAWERHVGDDHVIAAVFCELREGSYSLTDRRGIDLLDLTVQGGFVTEIDLRDRAIA
jgi:hypothetical protein